jgi:hypothetical protein
LILDDASTNSSDRLSSAVITSTGGTLTLLGHSTGSSESLGELKVSGGRNVVTIQHQSAIASTTLAFTKLTRSAGGAVNFTALGGVLGGSGNGPQIEIATQPTTNGVISSVANGTPYGYAVVEGKDFAGYSGHVVAVNSSDVSGVLASAPTQNSRLSTNGTIGAAAVVAYNTLKLSPTSSGLALTIGSGGRLDATGILLDGTNGFDFTITGGTIAPSNGSSTRYFHVWDPARTLTTSSNLSAANQTLTKAGDGFMVLSGTSDQMNLGSSTNTVYIAGGTLRANFGTGGNFGTSNSIVLTGGVLEIANGATFNRTVSINANNLSFQGSGGFSAFWFQCSCESWRCRSDTDVGCKR